MIFIYTSSNSIQHGIVLTANYVAKRKGVKTGMALWQAKQVCPDLIFVPPRMDLYLKFSSMLREIYSEYTNQVEPYGCDEAWLDVTDSSLLKGDGRKIAEEINRSVKKELGITVSIGISWNKIFAKLGSDYKKPDGITEFNRTNYRELIWKLPVSDLLYVGRSTNRTLQKYGIRTIGELARTDPSFLERQLGKMGLVIFSFANGWDDSPVAAESYHAPIKSIGNSTTTPRNLECDQDVQIILMALAESVAARLRKHGFRCNVVSISIRDNELYHFSRQKKIQEPTDITDEIMRAAYQLFKENYHWSRPIRSLGMQMWPCSRIILIELPSKSQGWECRTSEKDDSMRKGDFDNQSKYLQFFEYEKNSDDKMAASHAKILTIDSDKSLVSSANLSYHGLTGNIEMGFLVESMKLFL